MKHFEKTLKIAEEKQAFTKDYCIKVIQAEQLEQWKSVLKEEIFEKLFNFVWEKNNSLSDNASGYAVTRGQQLDSFVHNEMNRLNNLKKINKFNTLKP